MIFLFPWTGSLQWIEVYSNKKITVRNIATLAQNICNAAFQLC